ncbi:MAG: DUF2147 domain-containing protein [Bacteroidetes bacterium]|nr:DUF2147 domain-containing protein [Bacteroidota bacterium]
MVRFTVLLFLFSGISIHAFSQEVAGRWKTVDDKTHAVRSIVEIIETKGKVFGRIIKLFPGPADDPDPVCDKCDPDDPRFKKKVIGMEIIRNLQRVGEAWEDGDILDPENGRVYRSKIWVEGKVLRVRGYWGPFYRTQTWLRAE